MSLVTRTLSMSPFFIGVLQEYSTDVQRAIIKWHFYAKQDLKVASQFGWNSTEYLLRRVVQTEQLPQPLSFFEAFLIATYLYRQNRKIRTLKDKSDFEGFFFDVDVTYNLDYLVSVHDSASTRSANYQTEQSIDNYIGKYGVTLNRDKLLTPLFFSKYVPTSLATIPGVGRRPFVLYSGQVTYIVQRFDELYNPRLAIFAYQDTDNYSKLYEYTLDEEYVLFARLDLESRGRVIHVTIFQCKTNTMKRVTFGLDEEFIEETDELLPREATFMLEGSVEFLYQSVKYDYLCCIVRKKEEDDEKLYLVVSRTETRSDGEWFTIDVISELPYDLATVYDPLLFQMFFSSTFIVFLNPLNKIVYVFFLGSKTWKKIDVLRSYGDDWRRIYLIPKSEHQCCLLISKSTGYCDVVTTYMLYSNYCRTVDSSIVNLQLLTGLYDEIEEIPENVIDITKTLTKLYNKFTVDKELCYYGIKNAYPNVILDCDYIQFATTLFFHGVADGIVLQTFANLPRAKDTEREVLYVDSSAVDEQFVLGQYEIQDSVTVENEYYKELYEQMDVDKTLFEFVVKQEYKDVPIYVPSPKDSLYDPNDLVWRQVTYEPCDVYFLTMKSDNVYVSKGTKQDEIALRKQLSVFEGEDRIVSATEFGISFVKSYGCSNMLLFSPLKAVCGLLLNRYTYYIYASERKWSTANLTLLRECELLYSKVIDLLFSDELLGETLTEYGEFSGINLSFLRNLDELENFLKFLVRDNMEYIKSYPDPMYILRELVYYVNLFLSERADITFLYDTSLISMLFSDLTYFIPIHSRSSWIEFEHITNQVCEHTVALEDMMSVQDDIDNYSCVSISDSLYIKKE